MRMGDCQARCLTAGSVSETSEERQAELARWTVVRELFAKVTALLSILTLLGGGSCQDSSPADRRAEPALNEPRSQG